MNDFKKSILLRSDDPPETTESPLMQDALNALKTAGVPHRQTSPYQIKVGTLSLYPAKGTIYRDGDASKLKLKGVNAFIGLVKREIEAAREDRSNRSMV